jgi:hypothetical protein
MLFFTFTLSSNITIFCFSMLSSPPGMLAGAQAKVRMGAAGLVRYELAQASLSYFSCSADIFFFSFILSHG